MGLGDKFIEACIDLALELVHQADAAEGWKPIMKLKEKDTRVAQDYKVGDIVRKRTDQELYGIVLSTQASQVTSQSQVLSSKLEILWHKNKDALELQAWKFVKGATRGNAEGFSIHQEYPVAVEVIGHQPDWLDMPGGDKLAANRILRILEG